MRSPGGSSPSLVSCKMSLTQDEPKGSGSGHAASTCKTPASKRLPANATLRQHGYSCSLVKGNRSLPVAAPNTSSITTVSAGGSPPPAAAAFHQGPHPAAPARPARPARLFRSNVLSRDPPLRVDQIRFRVLLRTVARTDPVRSGSPEAPSPGQRLHAKSVEETLAGRGLWKCRTVENEENQNQVSLVFHRPWKSLRDSHIPTTPTTILPFPNQNQKTRKEPQLRRKPQPPSSGSSFDEKMLTGSRARKQAVARQRDSRCSLGQPLPSGRGSKTSSITTVSAGGSPPRAASSFPVQRTFSRPSPPG